MKNHCRVLSCIYGTGLIVIVGLIVHSRELLLWDWLDYLFCISLMSPLMFGCVFFAALSRRAADGFYD